MVGLKRQRSWISDSEGPHKKRSFHASLRNSLLIEPLRKLLPDNLAGSSKSLPAGFTATGPLISRPSRVSLDDYDSLSRQHVEERGFRNNVNELHRPHAAWAVKRPERARNLYLIEPDRTLSSETLSHTLGPASHGSTGHSTGHASTSGSLTTVAMSVDTSSLPACEVLSEEEMFSIDRKTLRGIRREHSRVKWYRFW